MNIFKPLIDFIFPPICEVCGRRLKNNEVIVCRSCIGKIVPSRTTRKRVKGLKYLDEVSAFGMFIPPFDEIIHLYKYSGKTKLSEKLVNFLYITYLTHYNGIKVDLITAVPLHRVKSRERGYNQSELLARGLSELTGIPYRPLLVRTRNTVSQTKLDRNKRMENVKGAFRCTLDVEGHVLLVDDVMTTGSTLNECARVLKLKGVERVTGLVLATAD